MTLWSHSVVGHLLLSDGITSESAAGFFMDSDVLFFFLWVTKALQNPKHVTFLRRKAVVIIRLCVTFFLLSFCATNDSERLFQASGLFLIHNFR